MTNEVVHKIAHDGFEGTEIGRYVTREGKRGIVLQQVGTRVVHVYGEKWFDLAALKNDEGGELQDFACKVSNLLWGGELGWTKTGLDGMFKELKERLASQNPADLGDNGRCLQDTGGKE